MKNLFFVFCLGLLSFIFSSHTIDDFGQYKVGNGNVTEHKLPLEEFSKIRMEGAFDIVLHYSDTSSYVEISTDENLHEFVQANQGGDRVVLKTKGKLRPTELKAHFYSKHYTSLDKHGSGDVEGETTIKEEEFNLLMHGPGNARLSLDADKVRTSLHGSGDAKIQIRANALSVGLFGSGDIQLSGVAGKASITLNGSGNVEGNDLSTSKCKATINGSGNINIKVAEAISVTINGSGNMVYQGDPSKVKSNVKGSGMLKRAD